MQNHSHAAPAAASSNNKSMIFPTLTYISTATVLTCPNYPNYLDA